MGRFIYVYLHMSFSVCVHVLERRSTLTRTVEKSNLSRVKVAKGERIALNNCV